MNPYLPIIPETDYTIKKQIEAMVEGRKVAVLIPTGAKIPSTNGFYTVSTEVGTFISVSNIPEAAIQRAIEGGVWGRMLGHIDIKALDTNSFVLAKDAQGRELQSSYCKEGSIEKQVNMFKKMYPNCVIETGSLALALRTIRNRWKLVREDYIK